MTEFLLSTSGGFFGAALGYVCMSLLMRRAVAKELTDQGLAERIAERLDELA